MTRIAKAGTAGTAALIGLIWAGLLGGCSSEVRSDDILLPLPASGVPVAIDVENFRGDVTVRVVPSRMDIGFGSSLKADEDVQKEEKAEIDQGVSVTAVMEDRGGTPTLVVRGVSQRTGPSHYNDIAIELPSCDGVRVKTGAGDVVLVGVRGAIWVDAGGGGVVEVRTNQTLTMPISLMTRDGNVHLQAPLNSTGKFDVKSEDGKVMYRAMDPAALVTPVAMVGEHAFTATLNLGTNPVVIHTDKGDVTVLLMEDAQSARHMSP